MIVWLHTVESLYSERHRMKFSSTVTFGDRGYTTKRMICPRIIGSLLYWSDDMSVSLQKILPKICIWYIYVFLKFLNFLLQ